MNNRQQYIIKLCFGALLMLLIPSCATTKNTGASRRFHAMKVRYNIFYNGNKAYIDGQQAIQKAHSDDFTHIIPLYPVSDHDAAKAAAAQMDKTIEKCRKAIKLHSIKAKPQPDPKRRSDPTYRAWLQQEEFNPVMGDVWIRLGEAEFFKGDFLGAIGTFTYIIRHFDYDAELITRAQLMIARAYAELGWQYEAEDYLAKANIDVLSRKHAPLYAATNADVMMKAKRYQEALPFIKIAMPAERRKVYRPRFRYAMAQIYELQGNRNEAINAYKHVIRMTPAPDMDFNARIRLAELNGRSSIKKLRTMTKQSKYKDRLTEIYGTMASIYLAGRDTAKALEYYNLAAENSTTAGLAKAKVLVTAGDIYYDRKNYAAAQPCYTEAANIIPATDEDYPRISRRAESLGDLVLQYGIVTLQDSLQRLAALSPEQQMAVAELLVKAQIEKELNDSLVAVQAARDAELNEDPRSVNTSRMFGMTTSQDWYFYNPQLIKSGAQAFRQRWGTRTLEDNWRRSIKTATAIMPTTEDEPALTPDSLTTDSLIADSLSRTPLVTDKHDPYYYLQQIPKTEADIAASDSLIADALYNLIYIYKDEVEDREQALATTDEFARRFPFDKRLSEVRYMWHLLDLDPASEEYKMLIRQLNEADSIYEATYEAYRRSDFRTVRTNTAYMEQHLPTSDLMPRFLFLNAVATARTQSQEAFITDLRNLVSRYPDHSLSAMAKDFLAMMGQGSETQHGELSSNLDNLRTDAAIVANRPEDSTKVLSPKTREPAYVLLYLPVTNGTPAKETEAHLNNLLYQTAFFNFTQFLIKDFELRPLPAFADGAALRVQGFESLEEAQWYIDLTANDTAYTSELKAMHVSMIPITESNALLVPITFTLEQYLDFIRPILKKK